MTIAQILVARDGITKEEADQQVADPRAELMDRLADGEMPYDLCGELFGLEPCSLVLLGLGGLVLRRRRA